MNRRHFLAASTALLAGSALSPVRASKGSFFFENDPMRMALNPGRLQAGVDQVQAVKLAHTYGFEAVAPQPKYLARLDDSQLQALQHEMQQKGLVFSVADLPVAFRGAKEGFRQDMLKLGSFARTLERAGVTRVGTYIMPTHKELTYWQNFQLHVQRLEQIANVLGDYGIRLGLEYVGTKTLWTREGYPFIHTMAETKDLLAEIGRSNVGFVLDSWHWYTANETREDLLSLSNLDIVAVDLNDAPAGIPREQQIDSKRELPMATGVIDTHTFLSALKHVGYNGPVRAEPFNQKVYDMPAEKAVAATAKAMKKAFALIRKS